MRIRGNRYAATGLARREIIHDPSPLCLITWAKDYLSPEVPIQKIQSNVNPARNNFPFVVSKTVRDARTSHPCERGAGLLTLRGRRRQNSVVQNVRPEPAKQKIVVILVEVRGVPKLRK